MSVKKKIIVKSLAAITLSFISIGMSIYDACVYGFFEVLKYRFILPAFILACISWFLSKRAYDGWLAVDYGARITRLVRIRRLFNNSIGSLRSCLLLWYEARASPFGKLISKIIFIERRLHY